MESLSQPRARYATSHRDSQIRIRIFKLSGNYQRYTRPSTLDPVLHHLHFLALTYFKLSSLPLSVPTSRRLIEGEGGEGAQKQGSQTPHSTATYRLLALTYFKVVLPVPTSWHLNDSEGMMERRRVVKKVVLDGSSDQGARVRAA
ncbi:hypothetical protein GYMLUDRAFT_248353 [Collybiopsis luxurians FD-317 M1]|uniref:Uncharacterized protein n=1 Tax=Collybiopsis luxurians FD-317 M1 TaxID=944289 RepID=A0A0D0C0B2_9AGAR|nr:hypothetical protein GYMLUDRAFT_248353 [Collybiopsis luxurians FD-317 M1]